MPQIATKTFRVAVKVDLPRDLDRAMEIRAAELDVSKRQFVEDAVRAYLKPSRP